MMTMIPSGTPQALSLDTTLALMQQNTKQQRDMMLAMVEQDIAERRAQQKIDYDWKKFGLSQALKQQRMQQEAARHSESLKQQKVEAEALRKHREAQRQQRQQHHEQDYGVAQANAIARLTSMRPGEFGGPPTNTISPEGRNRGFTALGYTTPTVAATNASNPTVTAPTPQVDSAPKSISANLLAQARKLKRVLREDDATVTIQMQGVEHTYRKP